MAENTIEVEIIARLDKVEGSLKRLETSAEKTGEKVADAIGGKLKTAAIAAGAAIATYLVGKGLKESIDAAIQQENAINRLNQSLAQAGRFSKEASQSFQEFASRIQETTTIGDETALQYLALANNFARTNDEAKKLTSAAIDLASATGISVDTAVRSLGGSLSGVSGQLARVVPQTRGLTEEQLKAGAAIDIVAQRFKGAAEGEVNTFSGAMKQLSNLWGDLSEQTGLWIIQSPSIVAAIKFVAKWLGELISKLSVEREGAGDIFKDMIMNLARLGGVVSSIIMPIFDVLLGTIKNLWLMFGGFVSAFVQFVQGDFAGAKDALLGSFDGFKEEVQFKGTEMAESFFMGIYNASENAGAVGQSIRNNLQKPIEEVTQKMKDMANIINGPVNSLISAGVSSIGASLVQGGKAFGNFAKTALNILGDFAIQLGMFIIGADKAVIALKASLLSFFGGAGIVAGLALVAIGGALKAFAGGPAANVAGSAAAGGAASQTAGDLSVAQPQTEERQPNTNVEVNIAGSVLGDKRTLGKEIADALNEAFGTDGITIARGAIV